MKRKPETKAHEIVTVICLNGVSFKHMDEYIVLAKDTSEAVSMLSLREGEEVLRARELNHKVIVKGKK